MAITVDAFSQAFPTIAHSVKASHIAALLGLVDVLEIPRGHVLIEENKPSDTFYMLLDGSLEISINADGQPLSLGKVAKGGCVGEMTLLDNEPSPVTVTAESDSTVLALSEEHFLKLDKQDPSAGTGLLRSLSHIMADRIRTATDTITPLLDTVEVASSHDETKGMLVNAYANLFGLGGKS